VRHGPPPDPATVGAPDAVLVSHLHLDHLHLPSLRRLGRDRRVVVPRGAGSLLRRDGFTDVVELEAGDELDVGGVRVLAVPAVHDPRRLPGLRVRAAPLGFVAGAAPRVYFAGDTALFDGLRDIGALGIDVALLPVWGWGASLGPGHLDPRDAARAAALVAPRLAVPIHWGTFFPAGLRGLRGRALVQPPRAFARAAAELAPEVEVRVLEPGASIAI
jgi:L-ascorbate metabolism protein UlaG (beta-lactamase superfamily)